MSSSNYVAGRATLKSSISSTYWDAIFFIKRYQQNAAVIHIDEKLRVK